MWTWMKRTGISNIERSYSKNRDLVRSEEIASRKVGWNCRGEIERNRRVVTLKVEIRRMERKKWCAWLGVYTKERWKRCQHPLNCKGRKEGT